MSLFIMSGLSVYTHVSKYAECKLESCLTWGGHVSIFNELCLYMHGVYMGSCLYIHESCLYLLIAETPPPRGGFLFARFPNQEPGGRAPSSKRLVQILRRGSSSPGFLIREPNKKEISPGGGGPAINTHDSDYAKCKLESSFDMYMGHVCIDKTACLYIHGIYMRWCVYIHESSVYVHMTAHVLDASESHVTVYTGVLSLFTIRHVFIYMAFHRVVSLYTSSIHGVLFCCVHVFSYNESCLYTPDAYMGSFL